MNRPRQSCIEKDCVCLSPPQCVQYVLTQFLCSGVTYLSNRPAFQTIHIIRYNCRLVSYSLTLYVVDKNSEYPEPNGSKHSTNLIWSYNLKIFVFLDTTLNLRFGEIFRQARNHHEAGSEQACKSSSYLGIYLYIPVSLLAYDSYCDFSCFSCFSTMD